MLERFKEEKYKSYLIILLTSLALVGIIVFATQIFSGDETKLTEKSEEPMKFEFQGLDDSDAATFRREYGSQLNNLEIQNEKLKKQLDEIRQQLNEKSDDRQQNPIKGFELQEGLDIPPPAPATQNEETTNNLEAENEDEKPKIVVEKFGSINIDKDRTVDEPQKKKEEEEKINVNIPTGSILKGKLLSGVDAPTGGKGQTAPHPVLIEIEDMAILPNEYRADFDGCFVIASAYGELSSERAYMRVEDVSCVMEDGQTLKANAQSGAFGYVSAENGKNGLSGRVVSKQGTMLARTIVAGFLEGASNAFQQSNTYVSTDSGGSTTSFDPEKAGETSMFSGAAEASKKLADFYMGLVNEMFPVIEINAGRDVDIILHKGVKLIESETIGEK